MRNENKLGRKFAACWGRTNNKILKRMANKGVRKNAKTLLRNNGNFFYCDKKEDLIKTLKALTKKLGI